MPRIPALCAALLAGALVLPAPLHAQAANDLPDLLAQRVVELNVPLLVGGRYVGDIAAALSPDGEAQVATARLRQLLEPLANAEILERLSATAGPDGRASTQALRDAGLDIRFDRQSIELRATLAGDARRLTSLSAYGAADQTPAGAVPPSGVSAGVTFGAAQTYVHRSLGGETGYDGFLGSALGFVNVGGFDGVYLSFEGFYDEDADDQWQRGNVTLFHDDWDEAIRYAAGDILPLTVGLQGAAAIGGLSVQRLYDEIQPYKNVRPSGRQRFVLNRESIVEVVVNGATVSTLRLAPGSYDLRDLPFFDGLNDVRLVVEDETGRREIAAFSVFYDLDLLASGIDEFGFTAGALQERESLGVEYQDIPAFTGFYRQGVSEGLTLGVNTQGSTKQGMLGAEAVVSTPLGLIGLQTAASTVEERGFGYAGSLLWRWRSSGELLADHQFDLVLDATSKDFATLDDLDPNNSRAWSVNARYRLPLPWEVNGSFGAGYTESRGNQADELSFNVTLSRFFGPIGAFVTYDHRELFGDDETEDRILLSLSYRFDLRHSARARYDSRRDAVTTQFERNLPNTVDAVGGRVSITRDNDQATALGEVRYIGNRFEGEFRHDLISDDIGGARQDETTTVRVRTGVGFSGGKVAVGRDPDRGFVIVAPHRTIADSDVSVTNRFSRGETARTDWLGPALAAIGRPYQRDEFALVVADLPTGYDIGSGKLEVFPGARSGYVYTVGTAASNTVIGRLEDRAGAPLSLISGDLVPLEGAEAEPGIFFTNRTGRFVAERLAPGRYALLQRGRSAPIGEITVPDDARGLVEVGTITVAR
ncbi:outer membrane usher protein [Constrictibacter sp. MBR-5]